MAAKDAKAAERQDKTAADPQQTGQEEEVASDTYLPSAKQNFTQQNLVQEIADLQEQGQSKHNKEYTASEPFNNQAFSSSENGSPATTQAVTSYAQNPQSIKAVNSLEALMSAVSNLDLMANPRALKKKHQEEEEAADYTLLTLPDDDALSVAILPDSYLPLAAKVFNYIDRLKQASDALEEQIEGVKNADEVDLQLTSARTTARSVSAQAVKLGVAKQDYVGTKLEVSEDLGDPDDPFSGGGSDSLPRAVKASESKVADESIKGSLEQNEINDLVQASREDKNSDAEDDAGIREPAVIRQDPALQSPADDMPSTELKSQSENALQADGVDIAPQFVEGLQDGESYEQMLLRVQQAALAQLQSEDETDAQQAPKDPALAEKSADPAYDDHHAPDDEVSEKTEALNEEELPVNSDEGVALQGNSQAQDGFADSVNEKADDNEPYADREQAENLQPLAGKDALNKETEHHQDKAEPQQMMLKELEDPFADETEVNEVKVSLGTSLEEDQAWARSLHKENSAEPDEQSQQPPKDVVGDLLRAQIFGKSNSDDHSATSAPLQQQKGSENVPAYDEIPLSDDDSFYESDPSLADPEDYDPDDEDEQPPVRGMLSEEEMIPEEATANPKEGISVLPDGRADDVPVAQQLERERIEQADKGDYGRILGPDDFMDEASRSDDWACDFIAAGYREGALYSALCASVRREDPAVADRWIVVMSDNFGLFAMDPNFTQGMMERFSALKHRHIEISLQTIHGIPKGSVKELAAELYLKACDDARAQLERMPCLQRIAALAGSDLKHCPLRLLDLKQEKTEH